MKQLVTASDSKRVLIIGNGFDLDLGWNTRFADFINSEFWPTNHHNGSILSYLKSRSYISNWIDLEAELGNFSSSNITNSNPPRIVDINRKYFSELVSGFKQFLCKVVETEIKKDSVASIVLSEILSNQHFSSIYSFNYTDLHSIALKLGLSDGFEYDHVHGSLRDDNIIIGAPEDAKLNSGYEFLYKTFSPYYQSSNLIYDLREAKEVVFFGHSLGPTDYHYFEAFFKAQCEDGLEKKNAKKITIFTYDDASRISILKQLRRMNNNKTNLLYHQNDFKIITTCNGSSDLDEFIAHLRRTSKQEHEKTVEMALRRVGEML